MAVIKNKKILKCLMMMVVSLLLILNFSIEVSTSTNYDRQEVDACITISQRLSVKGGSKSVHGNSKTSTKPQHGYEIYNKKTGDVVKTGISRQTLNKNGTSPRANTQVNKLNKLAGEDIYYARIVIEDMPDRVSALEWEKENALKLWEERNSMEIHKRPRPWEN